MELEDKAKVVESIWGGRICSIPWRSMCFAMVYLKEMVKFILFFQIDRGKTASAARNWTNFATQTDATICALSSNYILLLWDRATRKVWRLIIGGVALDLDNGPWPGFTLSTSSVWKCFMLHKSSVPWLIRTCFKMYTVLEYIIFWAYA